MSTVRLPRALCAAVGDAMRSSHATLDVLFRSAGAPGDPPDLSHSTKWKEWLFRAGVDPSVDSLSVLGIVLEEFMDLPPAGGTIEFQEWEEKRNKIVTALEESGFRYYRGGRVLPSREQVEGTIVPYPDGTKSPSVKLSTINELLEVLLRGLRRAMHPLTHRRKSSIPLSFDTEYDVQDFLHALLRPWVQDIRPEEFTPSYAGSSTRMDFLLTKHNLVIELKFVRDSVHAKKIGDELIIDIEHYRAHPNCDELWCVVFDQKHLLSNTEGLKGDLEGERKTKDGSVMVRVLVL